VLVKVYTATNGGALYQAGVDDALNPEVSSTFHTLVLCAEEMQPMPRELAEAGVKYPKYIYAPNDDSENPLTMVQADLAVRAAGEVARDFLKGRRILVSCMQGRNRSGLVTALALTKIYGMSGEKALALVQARVPRSLTNQSFRRFLRALPARNLSSLVK
jgi:protein-tyrosine phosphatase